VTAVDFLLERFAVDRSAPALAWRGRSVTFGELLDGIERADASLRDADVGPGTRVALVGDYSPTSIATLLALFELRAVAIPLLPATEAKNAGLLDLAAPHLVVRVDEEDRAATSRPDPAAANRLDDHEYFATLRARDHPGLVLFTSGSTGTPKVVVHDMARLLGKFEAGRHQLRVLNFLLFDHWGGLNTLLYTLSNRGLVVIPESRRPEHVCQLIEEHRVELLPASPTFLNMLIVTEAYRSRDLSSLRIVSYGAEPMPESTLARMQRVFPGVEFRQTYGLIELGVLRSKSRSNDSLWVKIGGEGFQTRVVDGLLEILAESSMLGYLNAPSPFTDDGWFRTGDRVEVDGEYFRILGRESELINVGGEKVYPTEVETTLLECPEVVDAVVFGSKHPVTGSIVCADVVRSTTDPDADARARIRSFCNERLDGYKVPVRIRFVTGPLTGDRQKRVRLRDDAS
jgi:long-chain acyl-CoA synthetase